MSVTGIDRTSSKEVAQIREQYLAKSRPVVLENCVPITTANWSLSDFETRFGDETVKVVSYKPGFRDGIAYDMTLRKFITSIKADNWESWWPAGYDAPYLARWSAAEPSGSYPDVYNQIRHELQIPSAFLGFNSRWPIGLRPGCEVHIFIGPRGARSYLHRDALMTHAWMSNFEGTKRWTLFAPQDTSKLYPNGGISPVDAELPDLTAFPNFAKAQRFSVDVGPGETIVVPAGWWHQVTSLTPTFSITGNFITVRDVPRYLVDIARHAPLTIATRLRAWQRAKT